MPINLKYSVPAVLALFAIFVAPVAMAQTTSELLVTAEVPEACTIDNVGQIPMDFGSLDPTNPAGATATAVLNYRCSQGTAFQIGLDAGDNPTGAQRAMVGANTAATLPYRLTSDSANTTDWGDVNSGSQVSGTALGFDNPETVTIYGVITQAAAEAAPVDNYSDTVTITLLP